MSASPSKPNHTARNTGIGVAVFLLFYVLSFGPALGLAKRGIPVSLIETIYAPLFWLMEHDKNFIGQLLIWYASRWGLDILF